MKKIANGKLAVILLSTACMLLVLALFIVLSSIQGKAARLELENTIERNFSQMLFAMSEGDTAIRETMEASQILGFGLYRGLEGGRIVSWGDAIEIRGDELVNHFTKTNVPYFFKSDEIGYDAETGIMRVIRPLGNFTRDYRSSFWANLNPDTTLAFVSFSAESYINSIKTVYLNFALFVFVLFLVYGVALAFALENLKIKTKLTEQATLVAMGQAARTLTHEIKNPLSAITLQLALLKRIAPEDIKEDLGVIDGETKKLILLTNRVSDFLRNPTGDQENVDLVLVVKQNLELFPSSIKFTHPGIKEAIVFFDADRLKTVVENVLSNAVEATEAAGKSDYEIEVELSLSRPKNEYILRVKDRGIGLKDEDKDKVFEPFFTTKVHGSGLGLPICKQFLDPVGGKISVRSRQNGGVETVIGLKKAPSLQKKTGEKNESTSL